MAHYTLIANPKHDKKGWRPCAVLMAGSHDAAALQARALRKSGGLAFVSSPARFRVRRSTRLEVRLMMSFFHSFGALGDIVSSDNERDMFFARRQKLLLSFFTGIFIDFLAMKKRYLDSSPVTLFSPPNGSGGGSGGGATREEDAIESASEIEAIEAQQEESSFTDDLPPENEAGEFSEASDDAIDTANHEEALAQILASPEANDGGKSRDENVDLDIL